QMVSIFLVTPSSVAGIPVQIKSESLSSRTELPRSLITERRPEWIDPARGLRKVLFDPIQITGPLSSIHKLLIIPDGVLNYVPFAALPMQPNRYLGEEFTVAYVAAAEALPRTTRPAGR